MKYLFSNIEQVLERLRGAQKILLLLDYDGTLTPIVRRPELARLSPVTRRLLRDLSRRVGLGIISGRPLEEVKGLVGVPKIIYAGNHGLEIDFSGKVYVHPAVKGFSRRLDRIARNLNQRLEHIQGVIVEHKGLTLSVHYRCVENRYQREVKRMFSLVVRREMVKTTKGKKILEVRPPVEWDKGKAVERIIQEAKGDVMPLYSGDDITDEDAFKVIRNRGITVYVGHPRKSYAQFFVWNVREVLEFLRKI